MKPTTSPYLKVTKSNIHSTGVFAKKDIPKGTKVIEYVGRKITKKEADEIGDRDFDAHKENRENGAVYLFELDKKFDLDGNVSWNTAKFINHSCDPNCEPENINGRIWIIALKDIKKGEEVTYNYGYNFDDYHEHPCHCKANNCVGYILAEEYWPKLRRHLKRKAKT